MLKHHTYVNDQSKTWVTFIHGAGGSSKIWFKQIRPFKAKFNLLLIDLRGHGANINSETSPRKKKKEEKYTFDLITKDIIEVLDYLQIKKTHFIGISLGTILIRHLAEKHPHRIQTMILGGAIVKLNYKSQILMKLGQLVKGIVPYLMLYKLFAVIIMPRKNHKESRILFVNEAKKLNQKEFLRWYKLTSQINALLYFFRNRDPNIKTLYMMGAQDHLFKPTVEIIVQKQLQTTLHIIKNCGHVVNIEGATIFNQKVLEFLIQDKDTNTV